MPSIQAHALDLVHREASNWADQLIDFGRRNTLLYYKQRKATTLDLGEAAPDAIDQLLAGTKVRLRALLPDPEQHARACVAARGLRRKLVELDEEQGIQAGWVARGLLWMEQPYAKGSVPVPPLQAPLIMHQLVLESRTATENDFTLKLPDPPEINPVLLYALERQFGVDAGLATLSEKLGAMLAETSDAVVQLRTAADMILDAVQPSGLPPRVDPTILADVFSFDKLPMVQDLRSSDELLAAHPVIAAMAGVDEAKQRLRIESTSGPSSTADRIEPAEEFLVHDADSSQQRVIDVVLAGRHVVIEGPPGTGKSQTIANIIALQAANGRSVLFVSEKRAAIEAVMNRLGDVRLDSLVFDLHDRKISRRRIAQQITDVLTKAETEPPVDSRDLHRRLQSWRSVAQRHPVELHAIRQPWGVSAFALIDELLSLPEYDVSRYNLRASRLPQLNRDEIETVRDDLRSFVDREGLRVWRGGSPWAQAAINTLDDVRQILVHLDELATGALSDAQRQIHELIDRAGLNVPDSINAWADLFTLIQDVERTITTYGERIFGPDLDNLVYATAPRRLRPQRAAPVGLLRRVQLRRQIRRTYPGAPSRRSSRYRDLAAAVDQRDRWRSISRPAGVPTTLAGVDRCVSLLTKVRNHLAAVAACTRISGLEQGSPGQAEAVVTELRVDREILFRLPDLNQQQARFRALGLATMLDDLAARNATGKEAVDTVTRAWLQVVFDEMRLRVPHLGTFAGREHAASVQEFRSADAAHISLAASRVRRNVAVNLRRAGDSHPDQNALVRKEAAKKSRHLSLRQLVAKAPDVLLAAFPCWAMSPLVVSRVLPAERLFDVIIFDEASQVEPHDAVASIMRGAQLAVAGDPKQLPPTPFFRRLLPLVTADDEEVEEADDLRDYESILDVLVRQPHLG